MNKNFHGPFQNKNKKAIAGWTFIRSGQLIKDSNSLKKYVALNFIELILIIKLKQQQFPFRMPPLVKECILKKIIC